MRKVFILNLIFSLFLITGCGNVHDTSMKEITEIIGNFTCTGNGVNKIEGYANCKALDGSEYNGDIRGHAFNGIGKLTISSGDIVSMDGYFYAGEFIAGKIIRKNGDSIKGFRENGKFVLVKKFIKENGRTTIENLNEEGEIIYGLGYIPGNTFWVNGKDMEYWVGDFGCAKYDNGVLTEITRTVTNTVYKNNGIEQSNLFKKWDISPLGSRTNPYNVNVNIK